MEYCKLQIGCLLLVLCIAFIYVRERKAYGYRKPNRLFEWMLKVGIFGICVDGITAYTVNHLAELPAGLNAFFHLCFLCSLDIFVYLVFLYMLHITRGIPWRRNTRLLMMLPLALNLLVVLAFLPKLEYRQGRVTNYSMGVSAYTCFVMVAVYILGAGVLLLSKWRHLERHRQIIFSTYLVGIAGVTVYQMLQPEALATSLVMTFTIIGAYLNMENPLFLKLNQYNKEMVMSFATIVENRDGSTGGHIRRTTAYVRLLAEELQHRGFYREQLTRDYINALVMAAPMHDIGKIAIPDAVLQKPGKLTADEYETMKTHAARGGQIIRETLGHLGDSSHAEISYEVATHHHEKWNGLGYPDGLEGNQIPLCARIMAVADVFDAVSANRCYRAALPLEQCFQIITEGSGRDFDPVIAGVFLDMKDKVKLVYEDQTQAGGAAFDDSRRMAS